MKGVFFPWLFKESAVILTCAFGSNTHRSASLATARPPAGTPRIAAGLEVTKASASGRATRISSAHWSVIRAQRIDGPIGEPRAQGIAVAQGPKWRDHVAVGIEVAEVDVRKVRVMRAYVAADGQPLFFGSAHHRDAFGGGQAAQVHARARGTRPAVAATRRCRRCPRIAARATGPACRESPYRRAKTRRSPRRAAPPFR